MKIWSLVKVPLCLDKDIFQHHCHICHDDISYRVMSSHAMFVMHKYLSHPKIGSNPNSILIIRVGWSSQSPTLDIIHLIKLPLCLRRQIYLHHCHRTVIKNYHWSVFSLCVITCSLLISPSQCHRHQSPPEAFLS